MVLHPFPDGLGAMIVAAPMLRLLATGTRSTFASAAHCTRLRIAPSLPLYLLAWQRAMLKALSIIHFDVSLESNFFGRCTEFHEGSFSTLKLWRTSGRELILTRDTFKPFIMCEVLRALKYLNSSFIQRLARRYTKTVASRPTRTCQSKFRTPDEATHLRQNLMA